MSDLSTFPTVFCDSLTALEQARAQGLNPQARIRTAAPALALADVPGVEALEGADGSARLAEYWHAARALCRAVHDAVAADAVLRPHALAAARSALISHRILAKALFLDEADFSQPRAALSLRTGNDVADAQLNPPWAELLADNPHFLDVPVSVPPPALDSAPAPWRYRLRLVGLGTLVHAAAHKLGPLLARRGRPSALVVKSNELLEDATVALALSGYAVRSLIPPKAVAVDTAPPVEAVTALAAPVMAAALAPWLTPSARPMADRLYRRQLAAMLRDHDAAVPGWCALLRREAAVAGSVVLSNFPGGPRMMALGEACRQVGVPLVVGQHGVTREISGSHDSTEVNYENAVADLFLAYNDESVRVTQAAPYGRGAAVAVGLPTSYGRLRPALVRRNRSHPLLYVSTALLAGNINMLNGGLSDIDRVRREITLVERGLGRLPHGVLYKTYPSRDRYIDPDPVLSAIAARPNMAVFDRPVDLRYLIAEHQVVIASRATSTIAWCLMSDRPFIFLDMPDNGALRPEARAAFADGLFLFDWRDDDMPERLGDFLSRPLAEIEAEWRRRAEARRLLRERYFVGPGLGAGRRAAAAIRALAGKEKS